MLHEKMVTARLSFVKGKHTQPPNVVLVPDARTFPVTLEWSMVAGESYVIGSHDPEDAHRWCVLDADLKQVMFGGVKRGRKGPKKAASLVSRTLHGGGAGNPRRVTFEFTAARLKPGVDYILVASRHGLIAAADFVVVGPPGAPKKAAGRKRAKKAAKKRPAPRKAAAKKVKKAAYTAKKKAAKTTRKAAKTAKRVLGKAAKAVKKKAAA